MSTRAYASIFALVLAPLTALGCADATQGDQGDEEIAEIQDALELSNGGMSPSAEQPSFGDPAFSVTPAMEVTFADPVELTAPIAAQPGAAQYHLMMVWGHLPPAHDQEPSQVMPSPVDWTGRVSVDQGAIAVKRTLKFDPHDGLAPRQEPNVVEFTSHTLPHVDGLLLKVVIPSGGSQVIHFQTAALTTDIDLSGLAQKAGGVTPLGDGRNGMAHLGFQDEPGVAKGFVFGHWGKLDSEVGRLRGRVVDGDGQELGRVRGIWGHAPNKDKDLFFGKYIAAEGEFRALFGGTYGGGKFQGKWGKKGQESKGIVEGHYSDGYEQGDQRGAFLGRWSEPTPAN